MMAGPGKRRAKRARAAAGPRAALLLALFGGLAMAVTPGGILRANPPDAAAGEHPGLPSAAAWELESIRLRDGRELHGLILVDTAEAFEFVEIIRSPGQPMHAILRLPAPDDVVERQRLSEPQRRVLLERHRGFQHRVAIELGRMDLLDLGGTQQDGISYRTYDGPWFSLWSTADDEMTRRCVVRLEQMVRAYRQLLPPRNNRRGTFQVVLYGSMDQYRGHLRRLGLNLENPAFYSASTNLIIAGGNLTPFADRLRQVRAENAAILRQYHQELNPRFDRFLQQLSRELQQRGGSLEEIALRRAAWDQEYQAVRRGIDEANRRNEAKFAEVTQDMFARLSHEAFHAYLENHVYPQADFEVPRWLNEGLAQVFESGQLDGDTLRIDAPSPDRLRKLREALLADRLSLAQLLSFDSPRWFASHTGDFSQRHYLYAWGLAYYLTFELGLLEPSRLDSYVAPSDAAIDPVRRFQRLVGQPLDQFETGWRQAMLKMP
ncbi:MAG: DUF1570 domain-containing protein [Pirellulaceae bacterium]|nr:DUF1570 domain-containing protein [Pirellulaceae bacterium]